MGTNELRSTVIRREAREALRGKWGYSALLTLSVILINLGVSMTANISVVIYGVFYVLLSLVLMVGLYWTFLAIARRQEVSFGMLFSAFSDYVRTWLAVVLVSIVSMIGFVLLIVPGVIVSIGLWMTFYILRDEPGLSVVDAMKKSWTMMQGHKMEFFLLNLSFFGWAILGAVTFVGIFFVIPYVMTAVARFYDKLKGLQGTSVPAPKKGLISEATEILKAQMKNE